MENIGQKTSEMAHLRGRFCFDIVEKMVRKNNYLNEYEAFEKTQDLYQI